MPHPRLWSPAADVTGAELAGGRLHVYIFIKVSKINDVFSRSVESYIVPPYCCFSCSRKKHKKCSH